MQISHRLLFDSWSATISISTGIFKFIYLISIDPRVLNMVDIKFKLTFINLDHRSSTCDDIILVFINFEFPPSFNSKQNQSLQTRLTQTD